jgi:glycosyltransferase involved in cell wall biosynthesis
MTSNNETILSVMVISHNQCGLIERCLESILSQKIFSPWEIVISDDASTDGTWDIIQNYVAKYSGESVLGVDGFYIPQITCSQINSSDYSPTVTSDRCAANKANVYMHANGKYCVNIDADDYLIGDDIYQYQISQLEAHPECSMSMQNILILNDGDILTDGKPWRFDDYFENEILSLKDYCRRSLFISNPAFMMRRDASLNPMQKYGLLFDDPVISMHHILQGSIVCTTKTQYVYVVYKNSIWNSVKNDDSVVRLLTPLIVYNLFFPNYMNQFILLENWTWVRELKKCVSYTRKMNVSDSTLAYVKRLNNQFITKLIAKQNVLACRIVLYISLFIGKTGFSPLFLRKILSRLIS